MITKKQIQLVRSLKQKRFRDETCLFVAEGKKLVDELCRSFELVLLLNEGNCTQTQLEQASTQKGSQHCIGVFRQKQSSINDINTNSIILALDDVQDPGNLGTIIRTADWFGVRDIVCSLHTADLYNPKVVQSTMGALSRVNVHYTDLCGWLSTLRDMPVYGTLLSGRNLYEQDLNRKQAVVVMGNEGNGISEAVRRMITTPLLIPSYPVDASTSESLNVAIATAVVLSEFRRGI